MEKCINLDIKEYRYIIKPLLYIMKREKIRSKLVTCDEVACFYVIHLNSALKITLQII